MLKSVKESADIMGISPPLFHYYLLKKKIMPTQILGGRMFFDEEYIKNIKILDSRRCKKQKNNP